MKKKTFHRILSLKKKTIIQLNDDQEMRLVGGVTNTEALSACRTNCAACPTDPIGTIRATCQMISACVLSCNGSCLQTTCAPC
ncbi:class I lanthipeptide [Taibaiella chishuiensis]|uniref:Uncharacterized protein n=1 Tax=Taibaiella chishuiensis TaxID=1434707 RepID=A0A2P8D634_9BACT|nr:class I lanthipeptide [Taibaiella chishuiensis]PSK92668.1 hypothetical protein B0I18_103245 [Taibaiella chishuiensis]